MENKPVHILLVEDDLNLGLLLEELLQGEGYEISLCRNGEKGWAAFQEGAFDLAILDIMLPELDGFHLAKRIRRRDAHMPIIFLTARSLKADKIKGFDIGADDYICKPFDEELLLCRIQAVLKRYQGTQMPEEPETYELGHFIFDHKKQLLIDRGHPKRITFKETQVLRLLCQHFNRIVRREEVLRQVWGKNDYFLGRSLDVFITKLRKYLVSDPRIQIENVFGVGFMLVIKETHGNKS